jgi:hypothetical protein
MQNESSEIGKLIKVYQPNWYWVLYALITLGLLSLLLVISITLFMEWERAKVNVGVVGFLCLIVAVFFLNARKTLRDYQNWRATRRIKLKIYEHGFVYAIGTETLVHRWSEVNDITYTNINVSTTSGARSVPVIDSIITNGGEVIKIPETFNRQKLTGMIKQKLILYELRS